jgi:predicted lipoprotein with Yx(FWY)xxD motif
MKRLLLPVMVPVMVAAAIALVIGGAAAGAHPSRSAHGAKAATIQLKKVGDLGKVLVNGHGQTLYLFEKDKHGKSACYGSCATFWPPAYTSGKPNAGRGVSSAKLGTVKRRDGKTQVTYNGHPLYAYKGDNKAGQARGEGSKAFGAEWYVVNAKGNKVDKS